MDNKGIREGLQKAGLKVSKARLELYRHLVKRSCAMTADDLYRLVKSKNIDCATVYRNLNIFVAKGLVQSLHAGDGVARFELLKQTGHHHHHLICRRCKKIEPINKCFVPDKLSRLTFKGFRELSHRIEFEGVCPSCN